MRQFYILVLLFAIIFTQCRYYKGANSLNELPNDTLINEVIASVIKLDSLEKAKMIQHIFIPDIYYQPKWDGNPLNPPPPTPPSRYGYSYDEIFSYFKSSNHQKQRLKDSIFLIQQIDTTLNHRIFESTTALLKKETDESYSFSLPIFSSDKETVLIAYCEGFYIGYLTILRKVDSKWIKIEHKVIWMR
jgi:hypothetical protein